METMMMRDEQFRPTEDFLKEVLKESYPAYELWMKTIISPGQDYTPEINFYRDGKAWLCKGIHKKKTVFWLSYWDGFFKITFYFTQKTAGGVYDLDIVPHVKEDFRNHKPVGKLLPFTVMVSSEDQLDDIIKVATYKRSLK
jgi:hypothetical protein